MFHRNFTDVFEAYDFIEVFDYDLCSFTHDLVSSQPYLNLKYT